MKQRVFDLTVNIFPMPLEIEVPLESFSPVEIEKLRVLSKHISHRPIKKLKKPVLLSSIQLPIQVVNALESGYCVSAFFGKPEAHYTPRIRRRINDCGPIDQARVDELFNQGIFQVVIRWWLLWHGKGKPEFARRANAKSGK